MASTPAVSNQDTPTFAAAPGRMAGRLAFIGGLIGATAVAHHVTPVELFSLHNLYQRLYYLPIFAAAFWFGFRGAVAASVLSAASYLPHITMDWGVSGGEHGEYLQAQYAELVMFQVVAIVVGLMAESERRSRERQARTAQELADAYEKLQESFEQLRRADRLTALGELSAGLAHEIKNPLASIKASLEILLAELPADHDKREFAEILDKELSQLEHIVNEFLQFARTPTPVRAPTDLRDVAASLVTLYSKEASHHGVRIEVDSPPTFPEIRVDAAQVQQALLNIVLNGIHVMPDGGTLRIRLVEGPGDLELEVCDQGPGIDPDRRERMFEPFYTTKARGTGLGLAIAQKLVELQGGTIRAENASADSGACFSIRLPLAHDDDG